MSFYFSNEYANFSFLLKEKKDNKILFQVGFSPQINSLSIRFQESISQIKYSIHSPDVFYALLHCTYLSTSGILMLRVLQGFFLFPTSFFPFAPPCDPSDLC